MKKIFLSTALSFAILTASFSVNAHQHKDNKKEAKSSVTIVNIIEGLDVIQGVGGNIAVLHGSEGVFVVDNGMPHLKDNVIAAINEITGGEKIKILTNTHWHFDHAGNNGVIANNGAIIIAHDNVRKRLEAGQIIIALDKKIEPAPVNALPILTYDDGVSVYLNGHKAELLKMDSAHTDGDSVIFWKEANILHAGDILFNGKFPFIDGSSGGSLTGLIKAVDVIRSMINEETKIIPGHGPLASKADIDTYYDMLMVVKQRVESAKQDNKTRDEWIKLKPLNDLDGQWGGGFMSVEKFTEITWDSL